MKKLSKEEYQRKFEKRTKLMAKKKRLKESRLGKKHNTLVILERRPGEDAPGAFLVRKRKPV